MTTQSYARVPSGQYAMVLVIVTLLLCIPLGILFAAHPGLATSAWAWVGFAVAANLVARNIVLWYRSTHR